MRNTAIIAAILMAGVAGAAPQLTVKTDSNYQQTQALAPLSIQQGAGCEVRLEVKTGNTWATLSNLTARLEARSNATATATYQADSTLTDTTNKYFKIPLVATNFTGTALTNWQFAAIILEGGTRYVMGTGRVDIVASEWAGSGSTVLDGHTIVISNHTWSGTFPASTIPAHSQTASTITDGNTTWDAYGSAAAAGGTNGLQEIAGNGAIVTNIPITLGQVTIASPSDATSSQMLRLLGINPGDPSTYRGGAIGWSKWADPGLSGYTYVNSDNRLVWDTTAQAAYNDAGVAWIDFDDGSASFASGGLTISSSGVLGGSGVPIWLASLTTGIDIESDTDGVRFGAANDAKVWFDGDSLNIKPNQVTSTDRLELQGSTQIGDATSLTHGINTAPVTRQMLTAAFTDVTSNANVYGCVNTLNANGNTTGNYDAFGNFYTVNIGGTNSRTSSVRKKTSIGAKIVLTDNQLLNGAGAASELYGIYNTITDATTKSNYNYIVHRGVYNVLTGNITTNKSTNVKYGMYNDIGGTAAINYGMYNSADGAAVNWALYNFKGNTFLGQDNVLTYWGEDSDASMTFDGNSLNIKANNVLGTDTIELQSNTTITSNLTVQGLSYIILPTATNGLSAGMLWNNAGTVSVMP